MLTNAVDTPTLDELTLPPIARVSSPQSQAYAELERSVHLTLETYSNVHRGSGYNSQVSTLLFEQARDIVLEYLGLTHDRYTVIFCSPRRAAMFEEQLKPGSYRIVSSQDFGLPLGVRALAVERKAIPKGAPFHSGGGTAKLVSPRWTIWADAPDKFEAGTPAIVHVIALAKALQLVQQFGKDVFRKAGTDHSVETGQPTADEILYHDQLEGYSGQELLGQLRQTLVGRHVLVPTAQGARAYINLDNAASTPTFAPIWEAVRRTWQASPQVQREIVREVKSICSDFLSSPLASYDVIFSSNTTEAINLVAESLGNLAGSGIQPVVFNTFLEHNSNELPWRAVPGVTLIRLPVDSDGFVDVHQLEKRLRAHNHYKKQGQQQIQLVTISGSSNVLGTFNNLAAIARVTHQYGAHLLVDAAQLVARHKIDMDACGIDYLAFSAHKAYAPFGSGVLVVRKGLLSFSQPEMECIRASGNENVGGIAALGKALLLLQRIGLDVIEGTERALTRRMLRGLAGIPGIEIFGIQDPDSPHIPQRGGVVTFGLKHVPHNLVAQELSELGGIGVRSGCFCAHLLIKRLLRMNPLRARLADLALILVPRYATALQTGLARVSLGIENNEDDVDTFLCVMDDIARKPRSWINRLAASLHGGTLLPPTDVSQRQDLLRVCSRVLG